MDIDPLRDTIPPRHAIESDDEDEYNPLPSFASDIPNQVADIKILGNIAKKKNIVLATGEVGKFWARGVDLGEQTGAVAVNGIQVGLTFNPPWTQSTVIVSEVLTRLPVWAMDAYARCIIENLQPPKMLLLDVYPIPTYISSNPVSYQDAPIRYLTTDTADETLKAHAHLFEPPNLVQSTSASFLVLLDISGSQGTLILLPSPHTAHPPPRVLEPSNFSHLAEDRDDWEPNAMKVAQSLSFSVLAESNAPEWKDRNPKHEFESMKRRSSEIGEGGMYI